MSNPYTPGAAHPPPYLAGRGPEIREFSRLLKQERVLENLVLTGIRGIGKTVLMRESLRNKAISADWVWADSDISEAVSVSENHLAQRLMVDLNAVSAGWTYAASENYPAGFTGTSERKTIYFDYNTMKYIFDNEPGLVADKIKHILLEAWRLMQEQMPNKKGIVFAWDEAQNFDDRGNRNEYPLGVLLDVFSSLQSQGVPFMLLLSGLPTLFPKLVESRTFAERMFRVVTLKNLNYEDSRAAVIEPLSESKADIKKVFNQLNDMIFENTKGYPYFIQFWCRELYDCLTSDYQIIEDPNMYVTERIVRKLDMDFFDARWERLTDRQRDLLTVIANLEGSSGEFSVQEIVAQSKRMDLTFSSSHVNQMLTTLFNKGMVFKQRHGKYVLAIPLMTEYILRRIKTDGGDLESIAWQK